jgi:hypothetical protein
LKGNQVSDEEANGLKTETAALAARLAPTTDRLLGHGLRCLAAVGLSLVPGLGAATREAIAIHREAQGKRNFEMFAERVAVLEDSVGAIVGADEFLASPQGVDHVATILEAVLDSRGSGQRDALAAAYLSGSGYGRFQPHLVQVLDSALVGLTESHVRVLRWCHQTQGQLTLQGRLRNRLKLQDLVASGRTPAAVVQKLVGDLIDRRLLMDGGINKLGGYWGMLSFAMTSFGVSLALFIESPNLFAGAEPILESPFPPESDEFSNRAKST